MKKYYCLFLLLIACNSIDKKSSSSKIKSNISEISALPLVVNFPTDNLSNPDKIELGRLLFYDPILSGNKDVAYASCHLPDFAYSDGLDLSLGVGGQGIGSKRFFQTINKNISFLKRNSQSLINVAFNGITNGESSQPENAPMFWDLRAKSLEKQCIVPIKNLEEMRGDNILEKEIFTIVEKRINNIPEYKKLFKQSFATNNKINIEMIAKAIATFERNIVSSQSRFDLYMRGDKSQLSESEILGREAFLKSGCIKCHNGPMFSDYTLHTIGVAINPKLKKIDYGTSKKFDFRTPSLRNLRYSAPYMHNGTLQNLQQVLEFYEDLSGSKIRNNLVNENQLDSLVSHIKLEFKDISLIIEFLNTLNDDNFDKKITN